MITPQLDQEIQRQIALSRSRFERHADDPHLSTIYHSEWESLVFLYGKLRKGADAQDILAWLKTEIPRMDMQLKQELARPTFDWYDEHHHYKYIEGYRDACRIMIGLLKEGL